MASRMYFDSNGNRLQSIKRINKSTVKVEICATTGFYSCELPFVGETKYSKWNLFDSAMEYFKERGFGFAN